VHIDLDVTIERVEKRAQELLDRYGRPRGIVATMPGGRDVIASAKRLLTATARFRERDSVPCDLPVDRTA
jgi:hypothetical protein